MHIICMKPLAEGVYNDHRADHITAPPEGWAYIPGDFPLPATFPRLGGLEAKEVDGVMTVTTMTEGTLPEPETELARTTEQRLSDLEETAVRQGEILHILLSGETEESQ